MQTLQDIEGLVRANAPSAKVTCLMNAETEALASADVRKKAWHAQKKLSPWPIHFIAGISRARVGTKLLKED
jgi:hypothetical protein